MSNEEWEYEYSTTETESLYFTLDLTTHVPDALNDQPQIISGQASKNNSAPRTDPSFRNLDDSSGGEDDEDGEGENQKDLSTIQVLDLHTSNPLIKFNQSVYSAYWTTDLGTQFHIAESGQTVDPLRKGTVLDVLGLSRARLLGKPVQLVDRNAPLQTITSKNKGAQPGTAIDVEEEEYDGDDSMVLTSGPLKIPKTILKTSKSKSQASFLERLSAIKHRKGEKDQVPIIAVKHYPKPANHDEIKRKAEDDDRNSALVNIDGRKRRRRRPMGVKARNAGGAGRPSRQSIEGSLGFHTRDHGGNMELEEDDGDDAVGVGMFTPGGRGEMREEVAEYLEDPFRIQSSGAAADEGSGQMRHPGAPATNPFSSPGARRSLQGREDSTPGSRNPPVYLGYQPRADYLSALRAEGASKTPSQALRPPWLGNGTGDDKPAAEEAGEDDQVEAGAEAEP